MKDKKVILITGALGFIGSYVTRACLDKGWYVKAIDRCDYCANLELIDQFNKDYTNFTFEKNDICELKFLPNCDYIINCAANTHVTNSIVSSGDFIKDNIYGVYNLLELIRKFRYDKKPILVHCSTDEVFSDILEGSHKETDLLKPSNPYSASKAAADMLILAWHRTYGVPYIIVRPTNNYGSFQHSEKFIPKICRCFNLGKKIDLHQKGEPIRNWLYAGDTALALIKLIESGTVNEIYNISGNCEQKNIDTVRKIAKIYKIDNLDDYIDFGERPGQDVRYSINDDKLYNLLGWRPSTKFDDILPTIVKFYKNRFIW